MDLSLYLPLQYTTEDEAEYCTFMNEAYLSFNEQGNYHFAYLAAHILMMYQIYLRLWQLAKIKPTRVIDALSLAHYDDKDGKPHGESLTEIVTNSRSPMTFKVFKIEERVFVKALTLLDCTDYIPFKKAIDFRNSLAHPNGLLLLRTQTEFENKIEMICDLMIAIHNSVENYLRSHIIDTIMQNRYSRPYVNEEIQNDVEQLLISPLMFSPYDCALISDNMKGDTKIIQILKSYLKERAVKAGYTYE